MTPTFSTPRVLYEHRQTGWMTLATACIPALGLGAHLLFAQPADRALPPHLLTGLCVLTAVALLGFASLSVRVTRDDVIARFGIGFVRRTVALDDIAAATVIRTRWYEGWGIHWTRRGMLYNVAGLDAVRLDLEHGKAITIGSDDAQRLVATIARAKADRHRRAGAPA